MLLLLVIGFGVLHNKDYNKYIFSVYFLFPQLLHKLQQTKQSFRLLVTTEESQENLSWVRDSTLQGHEKKNAYKEETEDWWFIQMDEISRILDPPRVEHISANRTLYYFDDL